MLDSTIALTVALVVVGALVLAAGWSSSSSSSRPPVYGWRWLPRFVRGVQAMVRLGQDEDAFLLSLRRYGPVVYIPWPMQQYIVTDGRAIASVYSAPSSVLDFYTIRLEFGDLVFRAPGTSAFYTQHMFPVHAKGMSKAGLAAPLERYVAFLQQQIEDLAARVDASEGGELVLDLQEWVTTTFFRASTTALFGPHVLNAAGMSEDELHAHFETFDAAFPIMASGMLPPSLLDRIPDVKQAREAQQAMAGMLAAWITAGLPGVEEGVIQGVVEVCREQGMSPAQIGLLLVADFWALQANAPFIALQLLLYLLQAPSSLRTSLVTELDTSLRLSDPSSFPSTLNFPHLAQTLPLLSSCITETLRLGTSSFSVRAVQKPFAIAQPDGPDLVLPQGSRLLCATRAHHLDEKSWDGTAGTWDGRRFLDEQGGGEEGKKSKRAREVHGFGGGISKCEGQHFATAELKVLTALFLSTFSAELLPPAPDTAKYDPIRLAGQGAPGFMPKRNPTRPGLGAFQFVKGCELKVRLTRRQQ
ncbi:hypothetical protein JCM10207_003039 [Rhodosporidiobolus poonsookiae]